MENSALLGLYGLSFFAVAVLLPPVCGSLRLFLGYTSYVIIGSTLLSLVIPEVAEIFLFILNGGIKLIWNLTE
jgi:hypothetical protein